MQQGKITPRGAVMQQGVFILYDEWNCAGLARARASVIARSVRIQPTGGSMVKPTLSVT